jgi:elongation factor Ts
MPAFTAKDVQTLRQATGAGMLDAKRALESTDGDFEAARTWLREKGLASALKRSERQASEGAVAKAITDDAAALVELRCETDFVAKADEFVSLADELVQLVAAKGEAAVSERDDAIDDLRQKLKENISVGRVVRIEITPDVVVGDYLHKQAGRGTNGVLVEMKGASAELAHDVAVHIAFARPTYLRRDDVPAEEVAAEREVVEQISRNEGKPEAAMAKVVEGRMQGWFKERCLLEQPYAKDDKISVAQLIGSAEIVRFAQVEVGA